MGTAPYGEPRYLDKVQQLVETVEDGSFRLKLEYFTFHTSTTRSFTKRFVELFGPPRIPETPFYTSSSSWGSDGPQARENQRYAGIAASIQRFTEEMLLKIARHAHDITGHRSLCMAGGVALNSVANGRLLREGPFDEVYIQPAAGDLGGALGAALYAHHVLLGERREFVMEHAYWGKEYSPAEIRGAVRDLGLTATEIGNDDRLAAMMVGDLLGGRVIALCQSAFEWGPRALGNRSILADPRRDDVKDIVNSRIKSRVPFRPFAPVILEERAEEYCNGVTDAGSCYPLGYMLAVYPLREEKLGMIPAVTHEGGTGRLQTIRREWNPRYHRIVERFEEATGVPVLLNTSFNLLGEPIACSPEDALRTFVEGGLDAMYMENLVVRR